MIFIRHLLEENTYRIRYNTLLQNEVYSLNKQPLYKQVYMSDHSLTVGMNRLGNQG